MQLQILYNYTVPENNSKCSACDGQLSFLCFTTVIFEFAATHQLHVITMIATPLSLAMTRTVTSSQ